MITSLDWFLKHTVSRARVFLVILALATVALVQALQSGQGDTLVCRRASMDVAMPGEAPKTFPKAMAKMKSLTGKATSDAAKMRVFMAAEHGWIFFGSNVQPEGQNYPTKIVVTRSVSLDLIASNLAKGASRSEDMNGIDKAVFFLDESLASSSLINRLDLGSESDIRYVSSSGKVLKTAIVGDGNRMLEFGPNVFGKALSSKNFRAMADLHTALAKLRISDRAMVVNFVASHDAAKTLAQRISPRGSVGDLSDPAANARNIDALLASCANKLLIAVAHLEGGTIAIRDNGGKLIGSLPISRFDQLCKKFKIDSILLGCHAGLLDAMSGPDGVIYAEDAAVRVAAGIKTMSPLRLLNNLAVPRTSKALPWTIRVDGGSFTRTMSSIDATVLSGEPDTQASWNATKGFDGQGAYAAEGFDGRGPYAADGFEGQGAAGVGLMRVRMRLYGARG